MKPRFRSFRLLVRVTKKFHSEPKKLLKINFTFGYNTLLIRLGGTRINSVEKKLDT